MENKTVIERAEQNLQRQIEWVDRHDTRTFFVAGVAITMLGVAANLDYSVLKCFFDFIWIGLAFLLLSASLICIYLSQFPKTESPNESLLFFGKIAKNNLKEFKARFEKMSDEEYLEDLVYQTHVNASIVTKKFHYLKLSLIFLLLAVIPWTIIIYKTKNQQSNIQPVKINLESRNNY